MDKACLECWANSVHRDSITKIYKELSEDLKDEYNLVMIQNTELQGEVEKTRKKLKRTRWIVVGVSGVAIIETVLLFFGFK